MTKEKKGLLCVMLSAVVFSFSGVLTKWIPWNPLSIVGTRALIAAALLAASRKKIAANYSMPNLRAGLSVFGTSLLFIFATKLTTAANAIVLQYAMPAIVILLCALVFKQRPSVRDVVTMLIVLFGVALCFADGLGGGNTLGDLLALGSAFTYALVFFSARLPGCDAGDYVYIGQLISGICVIGAFFDPAVRPIAADPIPYLTALLMGVILGVGYLLFSKGIKNAPAVPAAIVSNVEPVLNPIWVFLFLGEKPGPTAIVGAGIVLTAATLYAVTSPKVAKGRETA